MDTRREDRLAAAGPLARRFEMRGRPMDGWLPIDPEAVGTDEELGGWVRHGVAYARSLPRT